MAYSDGIIRFDAQFGKLAGFRAAGRAVGASLAGRDVFRGSAEFQRAMLSHLHHQAELFAARFRFRRARNGCG